MHFTKMHGLGNDFIIIDKEEDELDYSYLSSLLCQRNFGIGGDGLLVNFPSQSADALMRIYNADGSEAEMCGNGIRCFSKYLFERKNIRLQNMQIETLSGIKDVFLHISDSVVKSVKVKMGVPELLGTRQFNGEKVYLVNTGNPHGVIFTHDLETVPLKEAGVSLAGLNVEFVQVLSRDEIKVRVWERGVGETLACGTGACAAALACISNGYTDKKLRVVLSGGVLEIEQDSEGIFLMTGRATEVFTGRVFIDKLQEEIENRANETAGCPS